MEKKPIFLSVFDRESLQPPPIWLMRQAGRYLPEYQQLRKQAGSFWTMCMTPKLAVEITLQPIRRFDFDAAILFSDILVIPHALGQNVRFEDGVGPIIQPLEKVGDLGRGESDWEVKLGPVYEAMTAARAGLDRGKALIGFAGAPWTLAAYMIEGRGTPDQANARQFAYQNPAEFAALLEVLCDAVAFHLVRQIEAGAGAVQIFDSWAGGLPYTAFKEWVLEPTKKVIAKIRAVYPQVPIIGFPRATSQLGLELYAAETGVGGVGIDTGTPMHWAAETLGGRVVLQGNLDPLVLVAGGEALDRATDEILECTRNVPFVFNLGHGILPSTPLDHVSRLISRIRSYREGIS